MNQSIDCTLCGSEKTMSLVSTGYGFTGGDKWSCIVCKGYVVTRPGGIPQKEKEA